MGMYARQASLEARLAGLARGTRLVIDQASDMGREGMVSDLQAIHVELHRLLSDELRRGGHLHTRVDNHT